MRPSSLHNNARTNPVACGRLDRGSEELATSACIFGRVEIERNLDERGQPSSLSHHLAQSAFLPSIAEVSGDVVGVPRSWQVLAVVAGSA
jgi:hypothetical protein